MAKEAMAEGKIPTGAIAAVLVAWFVGSIAGAAVGTLISSLVHGLIIGGIFAHFTVLNLVMIAHPIWFVTRKTRKRE